MVKVLYLPHRPWKDGSGYLGLISLNGQQSPSCHNAETTGSLSLRCNHDILQFRRFNLIINKSRLFTAAGKITPTLLFIINV